jgi:hypothetical protein
MASVLMDSPTVRPTDDDDIVVVDDLDAFSVASLPGCGNDNPYT